MYSSRYVSLGTRNARTNWSGRVSTSNKARALLTQKNDAIHFKSSFKCKSRKQIEINGDAPQERT